MTTDLACHLIMGNRLVYVLKPSSGLLWWLYDYDLFETVRLKCRTPCSWVFAVLGSCVSVLILLDYIFLIL